MVLYGKYSKQRITTNANDKIFRDLSPSTVKRQICHIHDFDIFFYNTINVFFKKRNRKCLLQSLFEEVIM